MLAFLSRSKCAIINAPGILNKIFFNNYDSLSFDSSENEWVGKNSDNKEYDVYPEAFEIGVT